MKCMITPIIILLVNALIALGSPAIVWTSDYEDATYSEFLHVIETSDSCYVVAGWDMPESGPSNTSIYKYSASGDLLWESGSEVFEGEAGSWVEELSDGSLIVTGRCGVPAGNTAAILLYKTDADGNEIWSKAYDFPDSSETPNCVLPLSNGGFALCGEMDPVQSGYNNSFVMVTDAQGDSLWTVRLRRNYTNQAQRIVQYEEQLIVFIHAPLYRGRGGMRLIALNMESGEVLWEVDNYPYELSYEYFEHSGGDMTLSTVEEGFTIASSFFPQIAHTDVLGNLEWNYEIPYYTYPYGHSISNTMDGGYIYGGENTPGPEPTYGIQTGIAVKFDSEGNVEWGDIVWEIRDIKCIRQLSSGGYIACGGEGPGTILRYESETGIEGSTPAAVEITSLSSNPFAESLTVNFNLNEASEVTLSVYDLSGRIVEVIYEGNLSTGNHSSVWTPDNDPSGCYIIRLQTPEFSCVQNCVLIE